MNDQQPFNSNHSYPKHVLVTLLLDGLQQEVEATHRFVELLVERGAEQVSGVLLNEQSAYNNTLKPGAVRFDLHQQTNLYLQQHAARNHQRSDDPMGKKPVNRPKAVQRRANRR